MTRLKGPKTYYLKDIWEYYTTIILRVNPTWKCKFKLGGIRNFYVKAILETEDGRLPSKVVFDYKKFKEIIETYYTLAKERIVQGETLDLKGGAGKICACRVERNHKRKSIDFHETAKQPLVWSEEKKKMVRQHTIYFTDDDWCKIKWIKTSPFKNSSVYEFAITRNTPTGDGFNQMLSRALKADKFLKYRYMYKPMM